MEQVSTLKSLLKKLMDIDAEQEQFVQTIAMKTEGFSKIEADKCDALIEGVNNMLACFPVRTYAHSRWYPQRDRVQQRENA